MSQKKVWTPKAVKPTTTTPVVNPNVAGMPRIMVTTGSMSVEHQVAMVNGVVVDAPYDLKLAIERLATCHGLLITGGGDVNPRLYGAARHPQTQTVSATRDYMELALLGAARDLGMPVFGICRGMQVIAVEAGGSLNQHVPDKVRHSNHEYSMMPVVTVRDSIVNRALGDRPNMLHLHHQSVRRIPDGFQVSARHGDGTIEAIESTDGRVVAVQFHPESVLTSVKDAEQVGYRIFEAFVRSAARYRRRVKHNGPRTIGDVKRYTDPWPVAVEEWLDRESWRGGGGGHYHWKDGRFVTSHKPTGSATITQTKAGIDMSVDVETDLEFEDDEYAPRAWCGHCIIPFDLKEDHVDHMEYFHGGL